MNQSDSRSFDAAIFDMDGTLVFNMDFHAEAWVSIAREEGVLDAPLHVFLHDYAGFKNEELIPLVLGREVSRDEVRRIASAKEARYQTTYRERMAAAPGLVRLLDRLGSAGVRRAVATAAPDENRKLVLDGLDLRRHFEVVVGAEQVARGKPWPDIFLAAMDALAIPPSRCVIFEDAINGVRAAKAAGATCIGVSSTTSAEKLLAEGAHAVIDAFDPLPSALERMFFGGVGLI